MICGLHQNNHYRIYQEEENIMKKKTKYKQQNKTKLALTIQTTKPKTSDKQNNNSNHMMIIQYEYRKTNLRKSSLSIQLFAETTTRKITSQLTS